MSGIDFLTWVDLHPHLPGAIAAAGILLAVVTVMRGLWRPGPMDRRPDLGWIVVIFVLLAAGRWPSIVVPRELNPDESQLIAGAHTLAEEPVLWRSVDCGTAGPLDVIALWPAGWTFGWIGYWPARLTALLLIAASLALTHQVLALLTGRAVARAATLGATAFEALTAAPDLLHYSTELLPQFLGALALYAAVRRWVTNGGPLWCLLGGVALGATPFAKLQIAPLAAVAGLVWLAFEWHAARLGERRHLAYLAGGALIVPALVAIQLGMSGEWSTFLRSYLSSNFIYTYDGATKGEVFRLLLWKARTDDSLLHFWIPANIVACALLVFCPRTSNRALNRFTVGAAVACVITVACIFTTTRAILHYWQLWIVPGTCLLGALLARGAENERRTWWSVVALGLLGVAGIMTGLRLWQPYSYVGSLAPTAATPKTELSALVARYAQPGDRLAIWGWSGYVFVETGLIQGTREANIARCMAGKMYAYFRELYVLDLMTNKPALFLDSTGPCSLIFVDALSAHDKAFPGLGRWIEANYQLVDTYSGARLYRRRAPAP